MKQAAQAGDDAGRVQYETFLQASMLIFLTYKAEVFERKIPTGLFPKTTDAVAEVMGDLNPAGVLQ